MKYQIKKATAYYTGGGIYIYRGQLTNGLYFSTCDTWESIALCDADADTEDADYNEFYEAHMVQELTGKAYEKLFNKIIIWIIENAPRGNYQLYELNQRQK